MSNTRQANSPQYYWVNRKSQYQKS